MVRERVGHFGKAYDVKTPEDNKQLYGAWAETYDADIASYGYEAPAAVVADFRQYFDDLSGRVLDAGCGTGLVAKLLKRAPAFENVDGTDISAEMLAIAKNLNLYKDLFEGNLNETLNVPDATYDAIVCAGTFTHGHVRPLGMRELLRITKSGGIIVLSVNEGVWVSDGYESALDAMKDDGICEVTSVRKAEYMRDTACDGYIVVLTCVRA